MSDSDDETLTSFCDILVNLNDNKGDTCESEENNVIVKVTLVIVHMRPQLKQGETQVMTQS